MVSQLPQGTWGRIGNTATRDVFLEPLGTLESHADGKVKAEKDMNPLSTPLLSPMGNQAMVYWGSEQSSLTQALLGLWF